MFGVAEELWVNIKTNTAGLTQGYAKAQAQSKSFAGGMAGSFGMIKTAAGAAAVLGLGKFALFR